MKKENNEISEFVSESIEQIKRGLSKGYSTSGIFNFEVSVTADKDKTGKIGLYVIGGQYTSNKQHTQRIQFSIIDEKSRERNILQVKKFLKDLLQELYEYERLEEKGFKKKR